MTSTRLQLFTLVLCSALACLAPAVRGQPAVFVDVGAIDPPATPASVQSLVRLPWNLFDNGGPGEPGEVLTVKWLKFNVATAVEGELYLDIDSRITTLEITPGDLYMALYDGAGNLIATDDTDGSWPSGLAAGLSFGSTGWRLNYDPDSPFEGQDGNLGVGEYWLALLAGSASEVTAGASGWSASTTRGYQLGLYSEGTYYAEMSLWTGNTTPLPPPSNDDCANALTIGENPSSGEPVWTGTNAGATNDGLFPCEPTLPERYMPRTIWFNYIPTQTGFAEVIAQADREAPGANPILTQYQPGGCGTNPLQCAGAFELDGVGLYTRMFIPTVAGEPVLLALASRNGQVYPMTLDVNLLPPPCELTIPAGAIAESEGACEDDSNGGCSYFPPAYDTIALGQSVQGKLSNATVGRDTDWFEFTVPALTDVTVSFAAQYPSRVNLYRQLDEQDDCSNQSVFSIRNPRFADVCGTKTGTVVLEAGTYRAVIANFYFDGIGCGAGYEQYWLSLSGRAVVVACGASDIAGPGQSLGFDGELTADDIIVYLNAFFAGDPIADVAGPGQDPNADMEFTADDIIVFLNRFFAGC